MRTIAQLRKIRAEKIKAMQNIVDNASAEDREMNDEEIAQYDGLKAEAGSMKDEIDRRVELEEMNKDLGEPASKPIESFNKGDNTPDDKNMDETGFESFGDFVGAIAAGDHDRLADYDFRGQDSATGSEGGFLIPTQFQEEIMQVALQQSIVRERATVIAAGAQPDAAMDIPYLDQQDGLSGGISFSWSNDTQTKQNTGNATLKMLNLKPEEVSGIWTVPNKTLRNTSALSSLMMQLFGRAYVEEENNVLLFGNGVGKPLGALMGSGVIKVTRGTASHVEYADTLGMMSKRIPGENGYVWLHTLDTETDLAKLKNEEGQYIYKRTAGEGMPDILHGLPSILNQYSPALGNENDLSLVDLSKYIIKDGAGIMIDISTHSDFKSAQTTFRFINNIDAGSWVKNKVKLKNGLLTSPFISLK